MAYNRSDPSLDLEFIAAGRECLKGKQASRNSGAARRRYDDDEDNDADDADDDAEGDAEDNKEEEEEEEEDGDVRN